LENNYNASKYVIFDDYGQVNLFYDFFQFMPPPTEEWLKMLSCRASDFFTIKLYWRV